MDYSIGLQQPSNDISYTIRESMRYGGLPDSFLLNKFEETDMGDEEMRYNNFAREQIMAFNVAAEPTLESDIPRTYFESKGFLNLLHSGNRAGEEPAMPEIFTELTDKEPRRNATDPDYRELTKQWDGRMRFKYFYPDADNSITQGNWDARSQSYAGKAIQELMRARLQIFSTSLDGKRNEMRRTFDHKSTVDKSQDEGDYGEIIKNDSLNPQRATTVLSNRNLQRTKLYQQFTTDHVFDVSRYGEGRRGNYLTSNKILRHIRADNRYNESDMTQTRKALGILMSSSINQKKNAGQQIEYNDAILTQTRKATKPYRDLSYLIREISQDQIANRAFNYKTRKLPGLPNWRSHMPTDTEEDAEKPAHSFINTEVMYKGLKPGADMQKIKKNVLTDNTKVELNTDLKTGRTNLLRKDAKRPDTNIEVDGVSYNTHIYKTDNRTAAQASVKNVAVQQKFDNSDDTQTRKSLTKNSESASNKNTTDDSNFSDNTYKHKTTASRSDTMAIKRQIDRDSDVNEF